MASGSHISAVFLAAGLSRRMGGANKLLLPCPSDPERALARASAEALLSFPFLEKIAVLGRDAPLIRQLLQGLNFQFVENKDYALGQGGSVASGTAALSPESRAAFYLMADQPGISGEVFQALAEAFEPGQILRPVYGSVPGSPVLFDCRFYPELSALQGERGGSALFERHPEALAYLSLPASMAVNDYDRPEDFISGKETANVQG